MSDESAAQVAEAWYKAWNAHDLDAILELYSEDVVFSSPFVVKFVEEPDGEMHGKAELRHHFARALAVYPSLKFTPKCIAFGVRSMVLTYKSVEDLVAVEIMRFNDFGLIVEARCHYMLEA